MEEQRARSGFFSSAKMIEQPSAPAPAPTAADTTLVVSDDIISMVATFASCQDLCNLGQVCKRFSPLPFHEDLWELRALDILPGVPQLRAAMAELSLATCRELVETLTRIGIPCGVLGFWQAEPPSLSSAAAQQAELSARLRLPSGATATARRQQQEEEEGGGLRPSAEELEARGELLRIGLEAGGFVCESIAPSGVRRRIFTIRVSKTPTGKAKIGFFSQEREFSLTIGGDDDDWVPGDSMAEAKARYTFAVGGNTKRSPIRASGAKAFFLEREDGRICRYVKLTAPVPLSSAPPPSGELTASAVEECPPGGGGAGGGAHHNLCGLWCAPYGSHGLEIVQLSTDSSCSLFDGAAAAALAVDVAAVANSPSTGARCSWSRASIERMTEEGSESACTSAPATDAGDDSSEAGSYCDEGGSSGSGQGSSSETTSESESGDADADSESAANVNCSSRATTKRRRKKHRTNNHQPATAANDDGNATLPSRLFGFKVTGDENVPAGKTSFVIDLTTEFDVDEELQSDSRPVVMFLPSGAVMANMANRREQISGWHKGRGQINRVPGRWLPEWVDVEFVAYRPGSRCAFSVIFRQPAQAVRVVMDFERANGCGEGWPQWPATAAPAPAAVVGGACQSA